MKSSRIFNLVLVGSVLVALSGCNKQTVETTQYYNVPSDLEDCKFFKVYSKPNAGAQTLLYVVRCPHSDVTTKTGGKGSEVTMTAEPDQELVSKALAARRQKLIEIEKRMQALQDELNEVQK
jgi:hypothetical protein